MSADLDKLPADEEMLRQWAKDASRYGFSEDGRQVQNVLDALNLFRCRAIFAEQELARADAALEDRIMNGDSGDLL